MATISFESLAEALVKNDEHSLVRKKLFLALTKAQNELKAKKAGKLTQTETENLANIEYALQSFNLLGLSQLNYPLAIQHLAEAAHARQSHVLNHLGAVATAIGKEHQANDPQTAKTYFEFAKKLGYSESSYSPAGIWSPTPVRNEPSLGEVAEDYLKKFFRS